MKSNPGKGKGNAVSGIPMAGGFTQIQGQSVEPNREERIDAFKTDGTGENYAHDYFDDEEARLGDLNEPYVANKDDQHWSDGLQDEANMDENANDVEGQEGVLPELQPLHLDYTSGGQDDSVDTMLRPDNIDSSAA